MSTLELAFASGQLAALERYKIAWPAPTNPTVANSSVLQSQGSKPMSDTAKANLAPPTTPYQLAQVFDAHEQGKTRTEPRRKLSADDLCTTCRKTKHYGPCSQPRVIPTKAADFNMGMTGDSPQQSDQPSTSPHYHSATTADSALARARDGRPADEQAATGFADLFRHLGISNAADEPGRMYGGLHKVALSKRSALGLGAIQYFAKNLGPQGGADFLDKHHYRQQGIPQNFRPGAPVAREQPMSASMPLAHGPSSKVVVDPSLFHPPQGAAPKVAEILNIERLRARRAAMLEKMFAVSKLGNWQMWGTDGHSTHEQRGPSPNPYEERVTVKSPPVGWGDEGAQRIRRSFDQIDGAVDSTSIEDASKGAPQGGPAVLG